MCLKFANHFELNNQHNWGGGHMRPCYGSLSMDFDNSIDDLKSEII